MGDTYRHFEWVTDPVEYEQRLEHMLERGVVPVLRCDSADMQRRSGILRELGMTLGGTAARGEFRPRNERDIVVSLGPAFGVLARAFAKATGRVHHAIDGTRELLDLSARAASSFVFAEPARLTAPVLRTLAEAPHSFGVCTARSLEAASFVVAKLLAPGYATKDWLIAEAAAATPTAIAYQEGARAPASLPFEKVERWLRERAWWMIGLSAHSDATHVTIGETIGCGAGAIEQHSSGQRLAGCQRGERCRRDPTSRRFFPIGDVRASLIWFSICWGFGVAQEQYASDNSLILELAEGRCVRAIAARGLVQRKTWDFLLTMKLLLDDVATGEIVRVHNDLWMFNNRAAPYTLWGDPAGKPLHKQPVVRTPGLLAFPEATATEKACYIVDKLPPGFAIETPHTEIVAGTTLDLVLTDTALVTFKESSDQILQWQRFVDDVASRLVAAREFEDFAESYFRTCHSGVDHSDWLRELVECRRDVERSLQSAAMWLRRVMRSGYFSACAPTPTAAVVHAIEAWDRRLAKAIHDDWWTGASFLMTSPLVDLTYDLRFLEPGDACHLCGAKLDRFELLSVGAVAPRWSVAECEIHGLNAFRPVAGDALRIETSRELWNQSSCGLRVDPPRGSQPTEQGHIVVSVRDIARSARTFHFLGASPATPREIEMTFGPEVTADRQTIRAAWVQALQLFMTSTSISVLRTQ